MIVLLIFFIIGIWTLMIWRGWQERERWVRFRIRLAHVDHVQRLEQPLRRFLRRVAPAELWFRREGASWAMVIALAPEYEHDLRTLVASHAPESHVARVIRFILPIASSGLFTLSAGQVIDEYTDVAAVMVFRSSHSHGAWVALSPCGGFVMPTPSAWSSLSLRLLCMLRWSLRSDKQPMIACRDLTHILIPALPLLQATIPSFAEPRFMLGTSATVPIFIPIHPAQRLNIIGSGANAQAACIPLANRLLATRCAGIINLQRDTAEQWKRTLTPTDQQRIRTIDPFNLSATTTIDLSQTISIAEMINLLMAWTKFAHNDQAINIIEPALRAWHAEDTHPRHFAGLLARLFDPPQSLCALAQYAGIDRRVVATRWRLRLGFLVCPEIMGCLAAPGDDLQSFLSAGGILVCIQPTQDDIRFALDQVLIALASSYHAPRPLIMLTENIRSAPEPQHQWMHIFSSDHALTDGAWHMAVGGSTAKGMPYARYGVHPSSIAMLRDSVLLIHPATSFAGFVDVKNTPEDREDTSFSPIAEPQQAIVQQMMLPSSGDTIHPVLPSSPVDAMTDSNQDTLCPADFWQQLHSVYRIQSDIQRQYGLTGIVHRIDYCHDRLVITYEKPPAAAFCAAWQEHPLWIDGTWNSSGTVLDAHVHPSSTSAITGVPFFNLELRQWSFWLWSTMHHALLIDPDFRLTQWCLYTMVAHRPDMRITAFGVVPLQLQWITNHPRWFTIPRDQTSLVREQWETWTLGMLRQVESHSQPIMILIPLGAGQQPAVMFEMVVQLFRRSLSPSVEMYVLLVATDTDHSLIQLDGVIPWIEPLSATDLSFRLPSYDRMPIAYPPALASTLITACLDTLRRQIPPVAINDAVIPSPAEFWGVDTDALAPSFDMVFPVPSLPPFESEAGTSSTTAQPSSLRGQRSITETIDQGWVEDFVSTMVTYKDRISAKVLMQMYPQRFTSRMEAQEALDHLALWVGDFFISGGNVGVYRVRTGATLEWSLQQIHEPQHLERSEV